MRIHYLYSDKRVARAAIITFNGERQFNAVQVDDATGMLIRRTFDEKNLVNGTETKYGNLVIELPAGVKGGPYKTKATGGGGMNDLSNDGTGLRERLYAESENYGLHEDVRRLLREAHDELALSAVAPPPVLEVAIKALPRFRSAPIRGYEAYEGQMIIEAHDGHMIQRDRVLELIAASPAAPAQPEGGDAVLTTAELAAVVAARANADHDDDGSDDDDALDARMLVDALDKLLKFTRPAPAQQAWQPIESAPKDGTRVLLGWDDDGSEAVAGNWNADKYATKPRPYWTNDREHLFGKVHTRLNPPTHWQALPPPPTGE